MFLKFYEFDLPTFLFTISWNNVIKNMQYIIVPPSPEDYKIVDVKGGGHRSSSYTPNRVSGYIKEATSFAGIILINAGPDQVEHNNLNLGYIQ